MRFDDLSQSEDEPIRPKSIVPGPDRTSRIIRIRLLMLLGMLALVIYLMTEAGKPERWEWLGFEKTKNNAAEIAPNSVQFDGNPDEPTGNDHFDNPDGNKPIASKPGERLAQPDSASDSRKTITIVNERPDSSDARLIVNSPRSLNTKGKQDYPIAAVQFWQTTFRKLSPSQQSVFLRMLKNIREGKAVAESQQDSAQQLVRLLKNLRDGFHQELFDKLALASDGTTEKTRMANEMFESQEIWDKKIAPALDAASRGEEFTIGQQKAIENLQLAIDPILLGQVKDQTSIGWAGDSAAWKRIWEWVTAGDLIDAQRATRIELMGQPGIYRGRAVEVEGWVRSARQETLGSDSELGLSHYYILWIRPRETKLGPYCVYAMSLPGDFPTLGESFADMNESVRIRGYFFKVRNYVASDRSVKICPLIIAAELESVRPAQFTSVSNWQPGRLTLIAAFILIPIIATGVAWIAFRTSKTRPFVPGKKANSKIINSLNQLVNDPKVQTDHERIEMLPEILDTIDD